MSKDIVVLLHNIRSTHNVGSIFRTSDGLGVRKLILSGYTPYPGMTHDPRLPHLRAKITRDIHKTALGAEETVPFEVTGLPPLEALKSQGYQLVALEQAARSILLPEYKPPQKVALLLGEEVAGIPRNLLNQCDDIVEIPMVGKKESFNVSVAAAIALYQFSLGSYNKL